MKVPLLMSVPHAGLEVPEEVRDLCALSQEDVHLDCDEGAAGIYDLAEEVEGFATTRVARAIVDLNRAADDRRPDGVIKTHTSYERPVWKHPLPEELARGLIDSYWSPYHARLSEGAGSVTFGVDCHTMAAVGPPSGPRPGVERPPVCLSDGDGASLPAEWMQVLVGAMEEAFGLEVSVNDPFKGGYITRKHSQEMPWVQVELSRSDFLSPSEKRERVLKALRAFVSTLP